ncbi:MAG: ExeA family protein [Pseudorhodobacter sp.]
MNIYTEFFGLRERPFSLVPDPAFIYWSKSHQRAFSMLEYGIMTCAPITLVTGEIGSGKTTLLQHLLRSVDGDVRIALVSNAHGDRGELLRWVLMALDQPTEAGENYVDLFARFQEYLITEYAAGRRVAVILDEAQNLNRESLEELRMFTNINTNKDELLQLILVGQPELRDIIRRPDLRQFAQRVSAAFHLTAMDVRTVRAYIRHRLEVAGAEYEIFSSQAANLVHQATGGVPRLVNQLSDFAMVYAYTNGKPKVSRRTVQSVLDDGVFFAGETVEPERAIDNAPGDNGGI